MSEPKPTWWADAPAMCPYCLHAAHVGLCNQCPCWLPPAAEDIPPSAATRRPPRNQRSEKIDRLLRLIALLPAGLRADWDGTNHYELTADGDEKFWWLELSEITNLHSESETGRRVGLLLDIAEAAKAAEVDLLLMVSSRNHEKRSQPITLSASSVPDFCHSPSHD